MRWLQLALNSGQRLRSNDGACCSFSLSTFNVNVGCPIAPAAEAYRPLLDDGLALELAEELGLPGVAGVAGVVELGLVLDDAFALVLGLVELDVPRWNDDWLPWPPWPLTLKSCQGTGINLLSIVITAKSIRPLVGFKITSSILPTSSPDEVFTCAPMIFVLRKCCC